MPNPRVEDGEVFCRVCDRKLSIAANTQNMTWKAICPHCKITYQPSCEECGQALVNHSDKEHRKQIAYTRGNRVCYRCDEEKPMDQFYFKPSRGIWQNICRSCQSVGFKQWYETNKKLKNREKQSV